MLLTLLLWALQDPAPQPEAESQVESVTRAQVREQVAEVVSKFTEASAKLSDAVHQFEGVSLDRIAQAVLKPHALGDAVEASNRLVAEMEALLEMIPGGPP